jgi:hypothetical protein
MPKTTPGGKAMISAKPYPLVTILRELADFKVDGLAIPYPEFVPRLYNLCIRLGFRKGLIMPSRAFCSDENQGVPIILLTKHFGTFPFNHGRVGGIMAIDRHAPHASHGEDSVIVQASHVGYDPDTGVYGTFRRPRMADKSISESCGKLAHVITPYQEQYRFARDRIFLSRSESGAFLITAKSSFIDFFTHPVKNGLVLRLQNIAKIREDGVIRPVGASSTMQSFEVTEEFKKRMDQSGYEWKAGNGECMGNHLTEDLFFFREDFHETDESILLERNIIDFMPRIVTSRNPLLRAAKINIQHEFARAVESIRRGREYTGKNLLYIAGLNIDISEYEDYPPTTYFVPWAAHIQVRKNPNADFRYPVEQQALFDLLMAQSARNPDETNLKEEITRMMESPRFDIRSPK